MADYELIDYNGQQARKYSDGSIRNARGHMLAPLPGTEPITNATARSLAEKRWQLHTERVRERVTREIKSIAPSVTTPEDAYAEVVAKQTLALMDEQHAKFDDVDKLGQIMGARPTAAEQRAAEQPSVVRHEYTIDAETLALLRELRNGAVNCTYRDHAVEGDVGSQDADAEAQTTE